MLKSPPVPTCAEGSVVVYYDNIGPFHVAISRGDGTTDQHNNNRCSEDGNWGNHYVLAPYGSNELDGANASTAAARPADLPMPQFLGTRTNRTRSGLPCSPDHEVCHDGLCCPRLPPRG